MKIQSLRALLSKAYDELYEQADAVLKQFNPCQHTSDKNGEHTCVEAETVKSEAIRFWGKNYAPQCCCVGCTFWTKTGCTADKPLTCKTWLCGITALKNPEANAKLRQIADQARSLFIYHERMDKKESLELSQVDKSFWNSSMRKALKEYFGKRLDNVRMI